MRVANSIDSTPDVGTTVEASFKIDHIDRLPMGDLTRNNYHAIIAAPQIDYVLRYICRG